MIPIKACIGLTQQHFEKNMYQRSSTIEMRNRKLSVLFYDTAVSA